MLWESLLDETIGIKSLQAWLTLLCNFFVKAHSSVLLTADPDTKQFFVSGIWPAYIDSQNRLLGFAQEAALKNNTLVQGVPTKDKTKTRFSIASPIVFADKLEAIVAVEITLSSDSEVQQIIREITWASAWIKLYQRHNSLPAALSNHLPINFIDLVTPALEIADFQLAANTFVNEVSSYLKGARVSLGFSVRHRAKLVASSHTGKIEKRDIITHTIEDAMNESFDQLSEINFPVKQPIQAMVTIKHQALLELNRSKAIMTLPAFNNERLVCIMTIELMSDTLSDEDHHLLNAALLVSSTSLEYKWHEAKALPKRIYRDIAQSVNRLIRPKRIITKLIVAILFALIFALSFVPVDYSIASNASLEPSFKLAVVSNYDGYIKESTARAGETVTKDQKMAGLDDQDYRLELLKLNSEREKLLRQRRHALAENQAADATIILAQIEEVTSSIKLAEHKLSKSQILSPLDGVVITGDLSQRIGSPVQKGDLLFEVAPLSNFRVFVKLNERDIDEVKVGQKGTIVFSAHPNDKLPIEISIITPVATPDEGQNYFRVEALLGDTRPWLQPGLEGISKVIVGEKSYSWIWSHRLIDWFTLQLWRWSA